MSKAKLAFLIALSLCLSLSLAASEMEPSAEPAEAPAQEASMLQAETSAVTLDFDFFEFKAPMSTPANAELQADTDIAGQENLWIWGSCTQTCAPCRNNNDCPPFLGLNQKCWQYCP